MKKTNRPGLVPTEDLATHFESNGIAFTSVSPLSLNFGAGNDQYRLYRYPCPAENETMGVFVEWHTEDFFAVDSGPHLAIGMRGTIEEDPHRGRGLAIGILASHMENPETPDQPCVLFKGCPGPPGGPSFFLEDFSGNDGVAPIKEWQLSLGRELPLLQGNHIYRIDVHVSLDHVWAGIWKVTKNRLADGTSKRSYTFLGAAAGPEELPEFEACLTNSRRLARIDHGRGNAFIGTAFADPETKSRVDNIYIAHWKGSFPKSISE